MYGKYSLKAWKVPSSSYCEYQYCQPMKQWSTCLPLRLLSMNFEDSISCSLLSKVINCSYYRCAWACVQKAEAHIYYELGVHIRLAHFSNTFHPTGDMCALLLVFLGHTFGQCEKDGKVYDERVPESEQGFEHLTEPDPRIWSFFALLAAAVSYSSMLWTSQSSGCILALCLHFCLLCQFPTAFFHTFISFFPVWCHNNETASTATALKTINLLKFTQLLQS